MAREMVVSGTFYPARDIELERYFEHFSAVYDEESTLVCDGTVKAVIVPHAGYVYSGYTANIAFRTLQKSSIQNIVVIGPSHRVAFEGVSLCDFQNYDTPFGTIKNADKLAHAIKEKFALSCLKQAHFEHSTEVQFPFIKYYLPHVNIVELVYGRIEPEFISQIINYILGEEENGVVISTDLSHFYSLERANKLDNICLHAIENLDTHMLHKGCEACGMIGIEAMLLSAKKLGLKSTLLDHRTSADESGDTNRVVGYLSACFGI